MKNIDSVKPQGIRASLIFCLAIAALGCEKGPEMGQVDGVLIINGEPGHKVLVEFVPDEGIIGPSSSAETDTEGNFTLQLLDRSDSPPAGALVGQHRVVLSDLQLAESATGAGVPVRFPDEYTMPTTTPIMQQVRTGHQELRIEIP